MDDSKETYSVLGVRMEDHLKEDFMNIAKELGLTAGTIVNMLAKVIQNQKKIPFEITLEEPAATVQPRGIYSDRFESFQITGNTERQQFSDIRKRIIRTLKTFGITEVNGIAEASVPLKNGLTENITFILDWENEGSLKIKDAVSNGKITESEVEYLAQPAGEDGGIAYMMINGSNPPEPIRFTDFRNTVISILNRLENAEVRKLLKETSEFLKESGISQLTVPSDRDIEKEGPLYLFRTGRTDYRFEWPNKSGTYEMTVTHTAPDGQIENLKQFRISSDNGYFRFMRTLESRIDEIIQSGSNEKVSVHDCIRALTSAINNIRQDIRKRNEIFEEIKRKAEQLIDNWCETFPEQGDLRELTNDGDKIRKIVCSGLDNHVVKVIISEGSDLEYVYLDQICFENPEEFPIEEGFSEDSRFYVDAFFSNSERPLMAARSKTKSSDEWSVGFFLFAEEESNKLIERIVSEDQIDSFPGWLDSRERIKDGDFKNKSWADVEAVTAQEFIFLFENEVKFLEDDLLDRNRDYYLDDFYERELRDMFWEELKNKM